VGRGGKKTCADAVRKKSIILLLPNKVIRKQFLIYTASYFLETGVAY